MAQVLLRPPPGVGRQVDAFDGIAAVGAESQVDELGESEYRHLQLGQAVEVAGEQRLENPRLGAAGTQRVLGARKHTSLSPEFVLASEEFLDEQGDERLDLSRCRSDSVAAQHLSDGRQLRSPVGPPWLVERAADHLVEGRGVSAAGCAADLDESLIDVPEQQQRRRATSRHSASIIGATAADDDRQS